MSSTSTFPRLRMLSFGYAHSAPPPGVWLVWDLRVLLGDPARALPEELRGSTGLEALIAAHVVTTPGALEVTTATVAALQVLQRWPGPGPVVLAMGCTGGKHRSVAMAEHCAAAARAAGWQAEVAHRDVHRLVLA